MSGTPFTQLSRCLAKSEEDFLWFECPGCGLPHGVHFGPGPGPRWGWNGSVEAPTFTPSILAKWPERGVEKVCHSFVTDGRIQFLSDCTHALAGQTVPLADWGE